MPVAGGRAVSGSVRDDTVSAHGPVPVTAWPGALLAFIVSFPLMRVIRVSRRRAAWQPATRTAPGSAAAMAGSCCRCTVSCGPRDLKY